MNRSLDVVCVLARPLTKPLLAADVMRPLAAELATDSFTLVVVLFLSRVAGNEAKYLAMSENCDMGSLDDSVDDLSILCRLACAAAAAVCAPDDECVLDADDEIGRTGMGFTILPPHWWLSPLNSPTTKIKQLTTDHFSNHFKDSVSLLNTGFV